MLTVTSVIDPIDVPVLVTDNEGIEPLTDEVYDGSLVVARLAV